MRKTVYLPKYFPHLLLFLHSQSFKFPSGVIVLSTKCSHVKRSSEKNAESKGKQWASLSCCWDHTSSGQRRAPLPEALGTCLAVAATAALRLPGGRGGRGEKQQTGLWPSLPDPSQSLVPHPRARNRELRWELCPRGVRVQDSVHLGSRPGDTRGR